MGGCDQRRPGLLQVLVTAKSQPNRQQLRTFTDAENNACPTGEVREWVTLEGLGGGFPTNRIAVPPSSVATRLLVRYCALMAVKKLEPFGVPTPVAVSKPRVECRVWFGSSRVLTL